MMKYDEIIERAKVLPPRGGGKFDAAMDVMQETANFVSLARKGASKEQLTHALGSLLASMAASVITYSTSQHIEQWRPTDKDIVQNAPIDLVYWRLLKVNSTRYGERVLLLNTVCQEKGVDFREAFAYGVGLTGKPEKKPFLKPWPKKKKEPLANKSKKIKKSLTKHLTSFLE